MAQEMKYAIKDWKTGTYFGYIFELSKGETVVVRVANFSDAKMFSTVNQSAEYIELHNLGFDDWMVEGKWVLITQ